MGSPIDVEFFPGLIDGNWTNRYQEAQKEQDVELFAECLADVVHKWNLHQGGFPLAANTENIRALPTNVSGMILQAITWKARLEAQFPPFARGVFPGQIGPPKGPPSFHDVLSWLLVAFFAGVGFLHLLERAGWWPVF